MSKLRYYRVQTVTIERRVHERLIVARSPGDALAEYQAGTAWPSDYDTHTAAVIQDFGTRVLCADGERENHGDPNDLTNLDARTWYTRELEDEIPYPEDPELADFFAGADEEAEELWVALTRKPWP